MIRRSIFVTGTDTNVGKTIVSAILCKKLNFPYWKPVQSGVGAGDIDARFVAKITGVRTHTSVKLQQPLSPHLAASIDGKSIVLDTLLPPPFAQYHICEGAGGIFVPLNDSHMMIDFIKILKYTVVVVARSGLGTINHTCLTIEALRRRHISVAGVILNGQYNYHNQQAIEDFAKVKVLQIPHMEDLEIGIAESCHHINL